MTNTSQTVGTVVQGWTTRPLPSKIVLEGSLCTLEPLSGEKHAKDLFKSFKEAGDEFWTYIPIGPFDRLENYRALVDKISASDDVHFAIVSKENGRAVGQLCLMRCDPVNGVIEIGFVLFSPYLKKTTMATEAHYMLMKYVFEGLGYRRYEWKCNSLNGPSRKAALRLGFQYEGTFRQAEVVKGRNRDTQWFSIIDKEWIHCRSAFEKWLNDDNFEGGKQKQALTEIRGRVSADNR
ncbi:hypothetical protein ZYGR_0AK07710 [Zygosaccharomyces rouxii]|uniref:N-acetyltransferase domain-containing protein n=1 Tax=Zygosaccharomyces rouxii TaxID=4956 RepID=A0A1Q3AEZ0_ZYGRO|nr:hypothetical protein ZYGR_0AK07710 [Zygosaccharomyces rouxii]